MSTLSTSDADWPQRLNDLEDPPARIWLRGVMPELTRAVAIVGTRSADARGYAFARTLAGELAAEGWTIVSGGARGIDSAAHEGALDAKGRTVAVLASSVDAPTPASNSALFEEILHRGALLSEYDDAQPPFPGRLLARNRLIAALGAVVIVAQAPNKSGALSTAAHARRLGRPVLAVPYAPWEVRGAGCLTLLAAGAVVCRSARDVLSLAAPSPEERPRSLLGGPRKSERVQDLDVDERGVAEALLGTAMSADELCERSGLSAPRVQRAVLMLLLSGVIQEVGCGRYARISVSERTPPRWPPSR